MTTPAEKVVAAQHTELRQHASKALELRKQLEKVSKELSICKQQLHTSQQALHAAQNNVQTHQEYSRKLEGLLEHSGKGIALVKTAKLQAELDFFQQENAALFAELQTKSEEAESLQQAMDHQRGLVDQAARSAGFSNRAMLEEIVELKTQASSLSDTLLEKEALVKRLETELQDAQQYRHKQQQCETRISELLTAAEASESDKVALLEYIEEMQNAREVEQDQIVESKQWQKQFIELQNQMSDLQAVMSDHQQLLQACQQQCRDAESALEVEKGINLKLKQELTQLQAVQSTAPAYDAVIDQELQRMQEALQLLLRQTGNQANNQEAVTSQQHGFQFIMSPSQDSAKTASSRCPSPLPPISKHVRGSSTQTQAIHRLSYVAKQLQQLVTQHQALQQAWEQADSNSWEMTHVKNQLHALQSSHASCEGQIAQLTCQIDSHNMHWKALAAIVQETATQAITAGVGIETASELSAAAVTTHVCGREHQVVERVRDFSKVLLLQLCETAAAKNSLETEVRGMTSQLEAERSCSLQSGSELAVSKAQCQQFQQQLLATQTELQNVRKAQQGSVNEAAGLLGKVAELQAKLDANTAEIESLLAAQEQQHHQAQELGRQLQQAMSDKEEAVMKVQALQQVIVEQEEELLQGKGIHVSPIPMKGWTPCNGNPAGSPACHPPIALRAPQPQPQLNPVHLQLAQLQLHQRQQRLHHEQQRHERRLEDSLFHRKAESNAKPGAIDSSRWHANDAKTRSRTADRVRITTAPQIARIETIRQQKPLLDTDSNSDSDTSNSQEPRSSNLPNQTAKAVWDTVSKQRRGVKEPKAGTTPYSALRPDRICSSPQMPGSRIQGRAQRMDGKLLFAADHKDEGSAKAVIDKLNVLTASYKNMRKIVQ